MKFSCLRIAQTLVLVALFAANAAADITDFNQWTQIEDPNDPSFTGSVDSSSQVTLTANGGPIASGVDIGYTTVNGLTPLSSTQGNYFDPSASFSVAIDFSMAFNSGIGSLAFGMGIGEGIDGANSAGATLLTSSGVPVAFGGAARTNDITDATSGVIALPAQLAARLITSYDAASGNVLVGVDLNFDDVIDGSKTFTGIQNGWMDNPLLVSFFIRSDDILGAGTNWQGGLSNTTVTNFRVLSGSPIAVPEPQSGLLLIYGLSMVCISRRSRNRG